MVDLLVRDLLRSSIHAAKKRGEIIIRQGYEPTPATLAGLLLEQTKGNPDEALRMLVQMANYLRAVQRETQAEEFDAEVRAEIDEAK